MTKINLFVGLLLNFMISYAIFAESKALVVFKKGNSFVLKENKPVPINVNTIVMEKDIIRTEKDSYVNLQLSNGVIVRIGSNSQIVISKILKTEKDEEFALDINKGEILSKVEKQKNKNLKLEIQSPTAIASVRGTDFYVEASEKETTIAVNNGKVEVSSIDGSQKQTIQAGEKIVATFQEQKKGILENYEKSKFAMIQELEKTKKQNLENVINQIEKNQKLIEEQRNKIQIPQNPLNK
ncbi:MAG: FecR domain-containing protein [Leptonema sp. (in: bacteria)]